MNSEVRDDKYTILSEYEYNYLTIMLVTRFIPGDHSSRPIYFESGEKIFAFEFLPICILFLFGTGLIETLSNSRGRLSHSPPLG